MMPTCIHWGLRKRTTTFHITDSGPAIGSVCFASCLAIIHCPRDYQVAVQISLVNEAAPPSATRQGLALCRNWT
jgi:hypothetical protein